MNVIELSLLAHRLAAVCEEMGAALRRSAISPNIRDREDYSCALFDARGELVAQAAHIPVHLGSMAFCMRDIVARFAWREGDAVVFNDPFLGGTHLPDITVVTPLFAAGGVVGFAAARAHHADVGGTTAGSMGVHTRLAEEGYVVAPQYWYRAGVEERAFVHRFAGRVRNPEEGLGDLSAQRAACRLGCRRLTELGRNTDLIAGFTALLRASEPYGREAIAALPDGDYGFEDALEGDGVERGPLPIRVNVAIRGEEAEVDFAGSADQARGPVNCPLSVTAAAVFYAFRCLMPDETPQTSAIFRPVRLRAPHGSIVHALPGAAVAAGNVETSQRIVDVVLGALAQAAPERVAAASQGTMNNVVFAGRRRDGGHWSYYETLGGGAGAHSGGRGASAVQCHMTNTKNSSIEVLEGHYPLRVRRYAIRRGSGGRGRHVGGDGLVREWEALAPCTLSLLTERRATRPYGLDGGGPGRPGRNRLWRGGAWEELPAKATLALDAGDVVCVETPGGGGFGAPPKEGHE